jgi:long-chain acyl-CoA synthetase
MRSFFRLRCSGLECLPAERPFLMTPNHTSFLDPPALAASLDYGLLRNTFWTGWTGIVFKNALRRAAARLVQAVPIDTERGAASSLAFGAAVLKRRMALVWFPEGARSEDGSLQPFKPGVGLLLEHYPVPVVPVIIRGVYAAWPRRRWLPRFQSIEVRVHPLSIPSCWRTADRAKRPHNVSSKVCMGT